MRRRQEVSRHMRGGDMGPGCLPSFSLLEPTILIYFGGTHIAIFGVSREFCQK